METLISIYTACCLGFPKLVSLGIRNIYFKPVQYLLFALGYSSLSIVPYCKIEVKTKECNFEGYVSRNRVLKCLYLNGYYKRSLTRFMHRYLSKFNILVDIGSKDEYFPNVMGKLCKKVVVQYDKIKHHDIPLIKIVRINDHLDQIHSLLKKLEKYSNIIWIVETRDIQTIDFFRKYKFFSYYLPEDSISFPQVVHDIQPLENYPVNVVNCIFSLHPLLPIPSSLPPLF